jgi:hypothetical protein
MIHEERSIFWENIVADIAKKKGSCDHVSVARVTTETELLESTDLTPLDFCLKGWM